ncbi:hypothetical protein ACIQFP_10460 [Nocardiopsis alba]|uniref:hypothetical protein n=1 Tax=Nocardiopsis alba TaxID=53437 RepID=UPI0038037C00
MTNPNKRRGTAWESDIVRYLRDQGHDDARRVAQTGRLDIGDIHVGPVVIEAKNTRTIDLAGFVDQAEREAGHTALPYGVAVVKRRGKNAAHGYAVMSLAAFSQVIAELKKLKKLRALPDVGTDN